MSSARWGELDHRKREPKKHNQQSSLEKETIPETEDFKHPMENSVLVTFGCVYWVHNFPFSRNSFISFLQAQRSSTCTHIMWPNWGWQRLEPEQRQSRRDGSGSVPEVWRGAEILAAARSPMERPTNAWCSEVDPSPSGHVWVSVHVLQKAHEQNFKVYKRKTCRTQEIGG